MGITISTHNGSAAHRNHNIRDKKVISKKPNINPDGVYEIWVDEPPRKAYKRIFGGAVKEYNANQKRSERRIKDYYNKVRDDAQKHPVYEMIIGVYGQNENGDLLCSAEQSKEIMKHFVDNWKERNPNLELIGAYYHADGQSESPHVHLDYIPVAHGYQKGMHTQSGLAKALGEQGFKKEGRMTAQIQWEKRENEYLTKLCEDRGFIVDHPKIEGIKHLETSEYKLQQNVKKLKNEYEKLQSNIDDAKIELDKLNGTKNLLNNTKTLIEGLMEFIDHLIECYENESKIIEIIFKRFTGFVEPELKGMFEEFSNNCSMSEEFRQENKNILNLITNCETMGQKAVDMGEKKKKEFKIAREYGNKQYGLLKKEIEKIIDLQS